MACPRKHFKITIFRDIQMSRMLLSFQSGNHSCSAAGTEELKPMNNAHRVVDDGVRGDRVGMGIHPSFPTSGTKEPKFITVMERNLGGRLRNDACASRRICVGRVSDTCVRLSIPLADAVNMHVSPSATTLNLRMMASTVQPPVVLAAHCHSTQAHAPTGSSYCAPSGSAA